MHEQSRPAPVIVHALGRIGKRPAPGWVLEEGQGEELNDLIGLRFARRLIACKVHNLPTPRYTPLGVRGTYATFFSARRSVAVGAAALASLIVAGLPGAAAAATIKVTNQHNAGHGSLRWALGRAHDGDTILVPAGNYQLKSQLVINPSVSVEGAGPGKTILSAGSKSRVIDVTSSSASITIAGLTITRGKATDGGGILNAGDLTLRHVAVTRNLAAGSNTAEGGGIENSGTLTITQSEISDNKTSGRSAEGLGAGIADSGSVEISKSSITGNVAQRRGFGGALFFAPIDPPDGTAVSITTTTVSNNRVLGSDVAGGAILYDPIISTGSPRLPLKLTRDTFSGNVADGGTSQGVGGVLDYAPISNTTASLSVRMVNDTFASNRAGNSTATGVGGGLALEPIMNHGSAALNFTNLTIAHNTAGGSIGIGGGVVFEPSGTSSGTFVNTIIALNNAVNGPDCEGNVPSSGHNLERHTSCGFNNASGDLQNTNPKLGPLADNGGPTKTLRLLGGSPAINAGSDEACPSTDQRGISRPQGHHCDIGAYEQAMKH